MRDRRSAPQQASQLVPKSFPYERPTATCCRALSCLARRHVAGMLDGACQCCRVICVWGDARWVRVTRASCLCDVSLSQYCRSVIKRR